MQFNVQPRRLKLLARSNALDLNPRIASMLRLEPEEHNRRSVCDCCNAGLSRGAHETLPHFMMSCSLYAGLRDGMFQRIRASLHELNADGLFTFLTEQIELTKETVASALSEDWRRTGRKDLPPWLEEQMCRKTMHSAVVSKIPRR